MRLRKKIVEPETRFKYKLAIELSIIISLSLLILAFKFFPHIEKTEIEFEGPQELFTVEDIQQTVHEELPPPPPPKPNIIIAAPLI
jgi:periplasmic protein TonB